MLSRTILIATVAAFGFTSAAFAQALSPGEVTYINKAGKLKTAKLSAANEEKMAKAGHELPAGAVIYQHGGKVYIIENKPAAAGGKTMIEQEYPGLMPDSSDY
jgi:hypothetical protein